MRVQDSDGLLDIFGVIGRVNLSRRKFEQMVASKQAPQPIRFGRARRWRRQDVDRWLSELAERANQEGPRGPGRPRGGDGDTH
ncbi:MAG: hypothetical protein ACYCOU_10385 [Sulfobacillus sp.]